MPRFSSCRIVVLSLILTLVSVFLFTPAAHAATHPDMLLSFDFFPVSIRKSVTNLLSTTTPLFVPASRPRFASPQSPHPAPAEIPLRTMSSASLWNGIADFFRSIPYPSPPKPPLSNPALSSPKELPLPSVHTKVTPSAPPTQRVRVTEQIIQRIQPITQITKEIRTETQTKVVDDQAKVMITRAIADLTNRLTNQEQSLSSSLRFLSKVDQLQNTTIANPTITSGATITSGGLNLTDASGNLSIAGGGTIQKTLAVNSTTATSTFSTGGLTIGTSQFVVQQNSGKIGIGTTSPMSVLSVNSGQIVGAAGTAAAPTYAFSVDSNTGMFRAASSQLAFTTNGSEQLRIDNNGNLGIGTTTPGSLLSIQGVGNFVNAGTSTLYTDLTLRSLSATSSLYLANGTVAAPSLSFLSEPATGIYRISAGTLGFAVGGLEVMRMLSSGNVGIGTVPGALLHLATSGAGGTTVEEVRIENTSTATNNTAAQLTFVASRTTTGSTLVAGVAGMITDITDTAYKGALTFYTANNAAPTERARIDNNGNVGIGTTTPNWLLQVAGTRPSFALSDTSQTAASNLQHWLFSSMGGNLYVGTSTGLYATSTPAVLTMLNGGRIGVGTSSPWRTFSVAGTVGFNASLGTGTGGNYLCIDTTTFEVLRGNGSACTASSLRFKENIQDSKYGLNEVLKLRPVSYAYKPETNMGTGTKLGFIADEVQPVIPEVVTLDNSGKVFGLDYPVLTSVLAKAIQELNAKVTALASSPSSGASAPAAAFSGDALMVKKVASSLGKWSIDENGTLMAVKIITDEIITKTLKAQHAVFGSHEKPEGITIYDQITKQPGCVILSNGALQATPGECGSALMFTPTQPAASPTSTPASSPPAQVPSSSETATTSVQNVPAQTASSSSVQQSLSASTSTPAH